MEHTTIHSTTKALTRAESVSSLGSVYNTLPEKGDYVISGEVLIGVEYHSGQLLVHVDVARNLAAADKGSSNTYVQTYLLPDKKRQTKRKTKVVKKALDPAYFETIKYEVTESDLLGRTLWLSVWDSHWFGKDLFLGEVLIAIKKFDLSTRTNKWYLLKEKGLTRAASMSSLGSVYNTLPEKGDYVISGEVLIGVEYHSGQLLVHVDVARNLAAADTGSRSSNSYVQTYLLPDKKKETKRKTKVVKKVLDPAYSETIKYEVTESDLQGRTLWLSVWDSHWFGKDLFLGEVLIALKEFNLSTRTNMWYLLKEKGLTRAASMSSLGSVYNNLPEKGDYAISGEVLFGVEYCPGQLLVHVEVARNLAAADTGSRSSNSYVQTYLLPDKKKETKRKTKVVKKDLDPAYFETIKYEVTESDLQVRTLWLSVWDSHQFGKDLFLGEVQVVLKEFDLSTRTKKWYLLKDKGLTHAGSVSSLGSWYSTPPEKGDYVISGEILFGVEYRSGQLLVHVVGVRDLAAADKGGSSDPYVKTYLLPDKKKETKRKTKVVKKTLNPTYNETIKYKVSDSGLEKKTLCLSVWDEKFRCSKFLGQVLVPLSKVDFSQRQDRWMALAEK